LMMNLASPDKASKFLSKITVLFISMCAIVEPYHLISSIVIIISKIHYLIIVTLISFIA
jgi:hypothetical protein